MPYDPHITDIRGQLLGQGIQAGAQNAMSGIVDAITEARKAEAQNAGGDVILDFARKQGLLTPQLEAEYHTGNMNKKNGIIANLTRTFALEQQKQVMDNQNARLKLEQDATNFQPKIVDLGNGQKVIAVSPGHFAIPKTGSAPFVPPTQTTPVYDPNTGQQVGSSYQTGPKSVVFKQAGGSPAQAQNERHFQVNKAIAQDQAAQKAITDEFQQNQIEHPSFVLDSDRISGGYFTKDSKGNDVFNFARKEEDLKYPKAYRIYTGQDKNNKAIYMDVPRSRFESLKKKAQDYNDATNRLVTGNYKGSEPQPTSGNVHPDVQQGGITFKWDLQQNKYVAQDAP